MKDLIVIMGASKESGTMQQYCRQLKDADIDFHVEMIPLDHPNLHGGGSLGGKMVGCRKLVQEFQDYEKIIFSDAFDVLFYGSKEEVMSKIPDTYVLSAAEKNCYPEPNIAKFIPGKTPWRFFNGGLWAGTPENLIKWVDSIEQHTEYKSNMIDQQFFNWILAQKDNSFLHIDSNTELFFCLYSGYPELYFQQGVPCNAVCNTHPNFIHANGKWSNAEMLEKRRLSLENYI